MSKGQGSSTDSHLAMRGLEWSNEIEPVALIVPSTGAAFNRITTCASSTRRRGVETPFELNEIDEEEEEDKEDDLLFRGERESLFTNKSRIHDTSM